MAIRMSDDMTMDPTESGNYMLTTADNPWSPFTQFNEWYAFDTAKGYNTCAYIARLTGTLDPEMDDYTNDYIMDAAIDEILDYNLTGNYKLVSRNDYND